MLDSGWASVILTVLLAIAGAMAFMMRMMYDIRSEVTGTKAKLDEQDRRLTQVETDLKTLSRLVSDKMSLGLK
jgi:cell division protein FtsL